MFKNRAAYGWGTETKILRALVTTPREPTMRQHPPHFAESRDF